MEELDRWVGDQLKSPVLSLVWVITVLFTRLVVPYIVGRHKKRSRKPKPSGPNA